MLYVQTDDDLVIRRVAVETATTAILSPEFEGFDLGRLRFDGDAVVDIDALVDHTFFIDPVGDKRMMDADDRQELECAGSDQLLRDGVSGDWRVETDADRLDAAKADAKRAVVAFADEITNRVMDTYPRAETAGWATKQGEAAAMIAGGALADTVVIKAIADAQGLDAAGATALANAILAKAVEFATISAAVENLRIQADAAIDAVVAIEDIPATLEALKLQGETKAAELGLG